MNSEQLRKEIEEKKQQLAQLEAEEANGFRNEAIKPLSEFSLQDKVEFFDKQYNNVTEHYLKPVEDKGYQNEDDDHYAWEEFMETVAKDKGSFWKYYNSLID